MSVDPRPARRARSGSTQSRSRRSPVARPSCWPSAKARAAGARPDLRRGGCRALGGQPALGLRTSRRASARAGSGRARGHGCASTPTRWPSNSASRRGRRPGKCAAIRGDARRLRSRLAFQAKQSYGRSAIKKAAGAAWQRPPARRRRRASGAMRSLAPPGRLAADPPTVAGMRGGQ